MWGSNVLKEGRSLPATQKGDGGVLDYCEGGKRSRTDAEAVACVAAIWETQGPEELPQFRHEDCLGKR